MGKEQRERKNRPGRPVSNPDAINLEPRPGYDETHHWPQEPRRPAALPPEWSDEQDFPVLPEEVPFTTDPKTEEQVQDPKALAEYQKAMERFEGFWGSGEAPFCDDGFDESWLPVYTEAHPGDSNGSFGEFGQWERVCSWAQRQCSSEEKQEVVVVSPTVVASWELTDFERTHGPPPAGASKTQPAP